MKSTVKRLNRLNTFLLINIILFLNLSIISCNINSDENSNNTNNSDNNETNNADYTKHIPITKHPRLWLSAERLEYFKNAKNKNTPEWTELLNQCNALIDNNLDNDPYGVDNSPQMATAPLALVYLLTNDTKYADKAMELMDKTPSSIYDGEGNTIYGDPDHHLFHYFGLAYDWLYNYSKMTDDKKKDYCAKMIKISDSFWKSYGLEASGTDSDANLLSGLIHLVLGTAFYGDNDNALQIIDRGWKGWDDGYGTDYNISNHDIIKEALGGVYPTGFSYFSGTDIIGISGYWMSFYTAFNYDLGEKEPLLLEFWKNLANSFIQLTEPNREFIYPNGSWQDPNKISDQAWFYQLVQISSFFNRLYDNNNEANFLKGYAKTIELQRNGWFTEFFFDSISDSSTNPFTNNLPKISFAKSPDFLLFRNSWEKNSIWGIFIGDGYIPLDHQSPDQGHFSLWKGDGYLTKGARTYEGLLHGDFFNSLSIQNNCSYNSESCLGTSVFNCEKTAKITRHSINEESPVFAYSMLEADGQWNDSPSEWNAFSNVKTYRRHFFWYNNYVVIFDRVRTNNSGWVKYRLRALTEPIIDNNLKIISQLSKNGKYKLIHKTLEPSNVNLEKINEKNKWIDIPDWVIDYSERKWQTVFKLSGKTSYNILNIIQMRDSTLKSFDVMEHIRGNNNSGVLLGNIIVIFNSKEELREECSYNINTPYEKRTHLIADLKPGTYTVSLNGSKISTIIVNTDNNTLFFQNAKIGNFNIKKIN